MGNCLSVSEGAEVNVKPDDESLGHADLVQLLSFGDAPSKLMAAQKITHITCGPDDDAATHRAALLSVDVMHAIIDLMQPTNRAILRTAAAQAFCNLTLAAAEGAEGAERLAVSLPHVASAMKGLLMSDTVKDGALTVCQALCNLSRVPEIVPVLCASLAPLPPLVHHLVTACDATCKARFAQFMLNATLHDEMEAIHLDQAGGLQAFLQLLDDPRGTSAVHERALCGLYNLIREEQQLVSQAASGHTTPGFVSNANTPRGADRTSSSVAGTPRGTGPDLPRYVQLLQQPLVQNALQRQLRRPPKQHNSNCRYLAARIVQALATACMQQPAEDGKGDKGGARALKHLAMAQLLESLQHALLSAPDTLPLLLQPSSSAWSNHGAPGSATSGLCGPHSTSGALNQGMRADSGMSRSQLPTPSSSRRFNTSWNSNPAGWTPRGSVGAGIDPAVTDTTRFYASHDELLESLVSALYGLCMLCCRPPRGQLPQLAYTTAERLAVMLGRRGPTAVPLLTVSSQMLCLMSASKHAREQLHEALPAVLEVLATPVHLLVLGSAAAVPNAAAAARISHPGDEATSQREGHDDPAAAACDAAAAAMAEAAAGLGEEAVQWLADGTPLICTALECCAKVVRNMSVGQPYAMIEAPSGIPVLLSVLIAQGAPVPPGAAADTAPPPLLPSAFMAAAKASTPHVVAEAEAYVTMQREVQKQALAGLISLTRLQPQECCTRVLEVHGVELVGEAMARGLRSGTTHGAQVAAWGAALCCQLYVAPVEGIVPTLHRVVLRVMADAEGRGCGAAVSKQPAASAAAAGREGGQHQSSPLSAASTGEDGRPAAAASSASCAVLRTSLAAQNIASLVTVASPMRASINELPRGSNRAHKAASQQPDIQADTCVGARGDQGEKVDSAQHCESPHCSSGSSDLAPLDLSVVRCEVGTMGQLSSSSSCGAVGGHEENGEEVESALPASLMPGEGTAGFAEPAEGTAAAFLAGKGDIESDVVVEMVLGWLEGLVGKCDPSFLGEGEDVLD